MCPYKITTLQAKQQIQQNQNTGYSSQCPEKSTGLTGATFFHATSFRRHLTYTLFSFFTLINTQKDDF